MPRKLTALLLILLMGATAQGVDRATELHTMQRLKEAHPGVKAYMTDSRVTRLFGKAFGSGTSPESAATGFVDNYAEALGVRAADLKPIGAVSDGRHAQPLMFNPNTGEYKFTALFYTQYSGDIPVFRSELRLLVRNEADHPLVLASSTLHPLHDFTVNKSALSFDPEQVAAKFVDPDFPNPVNINNPHTVIWAGLDDISAEPQVAVVFDADDGVPASERWLYVVNPQNGDLLYKENRLIDADFSGSVIGKSTEGVGSEQCEDEVSMVMPYSRVSIEGANSTFADSNGAFYMSYFPSGDVIVNSPINGKWFKVFNYTGTDAVLVDTITPPTVVFFQHNSANDDEAVRAQVNAYVVANKERDYVLKFNPVYPTLADTGFPIYANRTDGYCPGNAWYDPGDVSLNLCRSGSGYPNTAWSSVIDHEYGHHLVEAAGSGQDQYGEGMGDVMSVIMLDDPRLGLGFYGDCVSSLRNADNTMPYPCSGEAHSCAGLLSGCIWDLRQQLVTAYPSTYIDTLANLAINAMLMHTGYLITPQITIDYLTLDDDDADLSNGTPNWPYICAAFGAHNMDCPELLPLAFSYPNGRPETINPNAESLVRVEVAGLGSNPDEGSVQLFYSVDGGGFVPGTVTEVSPNVYDLHLPSEACHSRIDWYITALTDDLQTIYNPTDAPSAFYSVVAATGNSFAAQDDFETDQGWTVEDSPGLTAGAWERGTPIGGGTRGDPTTDYDGSGQCYLTENLSGNSDVDDGTTSLISPTFDLSTGDGKISYARWYSNTGGSAPNSDSMEIWISNDNGAFWYKVETVGPVDQASGGWYKIEFWAGDYVAPTANMKMRFDASDLGSGSVVEAGIDDFAVSTYQCEGAYLCGDSDGDDNVNITDAVMIVAYIFGGGPAPDPMDAGDVNCDSLVNVTDAVYLLSWIFGGGSVPCASCK